MSSDMSRALMTPHRKIRAVSSDDDMVWTGSPETDFLFGLSLIAV
jgi:hypothetical protein